MEVTELEAGVNVPASAFEIPAGYEETQIVLPGKGGSRNGSGDKPMKRNPSFPFDPHPRHRRPPAGPRR